MTIGITSPRVYSFAYYSTGPFKGLLQSVTDPLSRTTAYEYDGAERIITEIDSDGKIIRYTYDEDGNLTSLTPPSNSEHTFAYNILDLQSSYVSPDVGLAGHTTDYTYNQDQQLDLLTRPDGKTIDFQYDSIGRMSVIDADGEIYTYGYSSTTGLLTSISDPSGGLLSFTYDGRLLLTSTLASIVTGKQIGRAHV